MALITAATALKPKEATVEDAIRTGLGIRVLNTGGAAIKLALSGYVQQAFVHTRDILETGFLVDFFRTNPEQMKVWALADEQERKRKFGLANIRKKLEERDGSNIKAREKVYGALSRHAHATYQGTLFHHAS
jgi:hypothetical protein